MAEHISPLVFCCQRKPFLSVSFYSCILLFALADQAIFPLWAAAPVPAGGLGMSAGEIGQALGLFGVGLIIFSICIYPPLNNRFGLLGLARSFTLLQIPLFVALPLTVYAPAGLAIPAALAIQALRMTVST